MPLKAPGAFSGRSFKARGQDRAVRDIDATTWSVKERKRLMIVSSLALVLVAIFALLSFIVPGPVLLRQKGDWCRTADCLRHARLLTLGLNRSVDPCHDFEAYVCSTWKLDHRFPFVSTSALDDLSISWIDGFDELLSKGAVQVSVARKPLTMYRTCVRGGPASEDDRWKFMEYVEQLGLSWPEKPQRGASASSVLVSMALHGEMPLWMRIRTTQNPLHPGGRRIMFLSGRASYIRLFAANHDRVMEAGDYSRYWKLMYFFLVGRRPDPNAGDTIKHSAEVQGTVVATLTQVVTSARPTAPVLYNLSSVQQHAADATFGRWLTALTERLKPQAPLSLGDDVLFANSQFIFAINNFLNTMNDADALVHISWQFVQMYAPMLDKAFLEDIMGDRQTAASYLAMLCVREVEAVYSPLLVALYSRLKLLPYGKTHANFVLHTLVQKAIESLNTAAWLEADDRLFLANKLESAPVRLWPSGLFDSASSAEKLYADCPESGATFSVLWIKARRCRRELLLGSQRGNASALRPNLTPLTAYDSVLNTFDVAIAALASPLYYTHSTLGSVYGGFGFIFALAVMGVLREPHHYFHPNGSVLQKGFWLSNKSTEALQRKLRCPELEHEASRGDVIVAVEVTQSAFLERLARSAQLNLTRELTDEKVFFMTLCRAACVRKGEKETPWFPARCNELVRNFDEFWGTFGCSKPSTPKCKFFRQE